MQCGCHDPYAKVLDAGSFTYTNEESKGRLSDGAYDIMVLEPRPLNGLLADDITKAHQKTWKSVNHSNITQTNNANDKKKQC